ncbi:biopolymer transporter ExbD [Roseibium sp. RKSG952]|uniref:biopolymer transporter ExbD n=1 Tax=Roseibium sp. RKSG952 TaxID=2529384 RepID=UPI0012BBF3F8|nr:biopolymer transporter ExbD [Roseibium sp. RKSG952]MTI00175.1 biopolymer transporter ExbD [Roseibium sp. RKSG952]
MHINRPQRRARPISLTPLVDVIFLLLLFFMLSSTFTRFGEVEIGAPGGGGGTGAVPKALLLVEGDALRLNGNAVEPDRLHGEAEALTARDIDSLLVLVRGETTTQQLVTVLSDLKSVENLSVTLAR